MTVAEVKSWLTDYKVGDRELQLQMERRSTLMEKMYSVGSPEMTDMPKAPSPSVDKMSLLVARKIELDRKIEKAVERQQKCREDIECAIERLKVPDQRAVIRMRYLDGSAWDKVNEMMFGSDDEFADRYDSFMRRVFIIHGQALQRLAELMK